MNTTDDTAEPGRRACCLLALNPNSRRGGEPGDRITQLLRSEGFELRHAPVADPQALRQILREHGASLSPRTDRIFVGGGDGTVNHLLSTLVESPVPVVLLPLGTANDLARTLGVPEDLEAAVALARDGVPVPIDLGRVNGHLFANAASLGLGTKVTESLTGDAKARLGAMAYLRAVLIAYRGVRPFRCRVEYDGGARRRFRAIHVAVGNGRHYGGGATVGEEASIDDKRLDMYAVAPVPLWRLLLAAPLFRRGRHGALDAVTTLRSGRIVIRTSRPLAISADGEVLTQTPARFEVVSNALTVMVPPDEPGDGVTRLAR